MMSTNIFEKAARYRYRFDTPNGSISVEELWTLPICTECEDKYDLIDVYKDITKRIEQRNAITKALNKPEIVDDHLDTKLKVVTHIIRTKLEEGAEDTEIVKKRHLFKQVII